MSIETILAFALALGIAAASPGPGVVGIIARSLGFGFRAGMMMTLGLVLGDLVFLLLSIFGMAVLAAQLGELFLAVKLAGAAYLVYLGWKLWRAPAKAITSASVGALREPPFRSFVSGFLLTLGNPKTMVFYLAILPTVIDLETVTLLSAAELSGVVVVVLLLVLTPYVAVAARARRLFANPRAVRALNRGTGTLLIGAGVGVAAT